MHDQIGKRIFILVMFVNKPDTVFVDDVIVTTQFYKEIFSLLS